MDIDTGILSFYDVFCSSNTDDVFMSTNGGPFPMLTSGFTNVANIGSAAVAPKVYLRGPGTLVWLENQTTGQRISLNLVLQSTEEVFIDFALGLITSTLRGSLLYTLYPGSDFQAFKLAPGNNTIACLMTNDVNAFMSMYYTPQHWSADATQRDGNG
jgi:hypothetical protein